MAKKFLNDDQLLNQYLSDIRKFPLLERNEETILIKKTLAGDKRAERKLVLSNLRFVVNVAMVYRNQGMSIVELINEGNIGLIESARRFDLGRNVKFISYAVWWIRQSMLRALSEKSRMVRISAEKELAYKRISKNARKMKQVIGGHMVIDTEDMVPDHTYKGEKAAQVLSMGQWHSSLDTPITEDGSSLMDISRSLDATPEENAMENSQRTYMDQFINKLNEKERTVISLYFGINEQDNLNLKDIGSMIGLSKERVRQIKDSALSHLREMGIERELLLGAA
ncbi:MAG: RNA polymerase sigma factor RpoD/SigA [Fibrobacterales bacterium]